MAKKASKTHRSFCQDGDEIVRIGNMIVPMSRIKTISYSHSGDLWIGIKGQDKEVHFPFIYEEHIKIPGFIRSQPSPGKNLAREVAQTIGRKCGIPVSVVDD
jgi:hypothetical protein